MIIIKVQGGLGNQLFQYALGRLLEEKYQKTVAYDITFFTENNKYTKRKFFLNFFKAKVTIATPAEIQAVKYPHGYSSVFFWFLRKAYNKYITKKYDIVYNQQLLKTCSKKDSMYMEGYYQSYKYVTPVLDQLNDELELSVPLPENAQVLKDSIITTESVSIHIRRGDYVTNSTSLQTLSKEYYQKAISEIATRISDPKLYVFSDDSEWVRKEMGELFPGAVFMSEYQLEDNVEFYLLSLCKHAIIANSSFSWWGAMLHSHADSMVICPKDWKNIYLAGDSNLCPTEWKVL